MPQTLSPFRYPGGKDQLYPFVRNILQLNNIHGTYVETFAGGSALGLRLLFNEEIDKIVINDLDSSIFSVWNAILCSPTISLLKLILFRLTTTMLALIQSIWSIGKSSVAFIFRKRKTHILLKVHLQLFSLTAQLEAE